MKNVYDIITLYIIVYQDSGAQGDDRFKEFFPWSGLRIRRREWNGYLLNIKEAAEILNASEMTVRRWTNGGSLHCYRIGGKHERRFRIQDLKDYLEKGGMQAGTACEVPIGFEELTVPDGSHMTHLSLETIEALEVGASYVLEGLNKGETVLLVALAEKRESILHMLQERGADWIVPGAARLSPFKIHRKRRDEMGTYYDPNDRAAFSEVGKDATELAKKIFDYYGAVFAEGELTEREKALIALAVAHAVQCPYCIDAYTRACLEKGINLAEMTEAVHVASTKKKDGTAKKTVTSGTEI